MSPQTSVPKNGGGYDLTQKTGRRTSVFFFGVNSFFVKNHVRFEPVGHIPPWRCPRAPKQAQEVRNETEEHSSPPWDTNTSRPPASSLHGQSPWTISMDNAFPQSPAELAHRNE